MTIDVKNQIGLIYFIIGILYGMYRWDKDIQYVLIWRYYCLVFSIIYWPIAILDQLRNYIKVKKLKKIL